MWLEDAVETLFSWGDAFRAAGKWTAAQVEVWRSIVANLADITDAEEEGPEKMLSRLAEILGGSPWAQLPGSEKLRTAILSALQTTTTERQALEDSGAWAVLRDAVVKTAQDVKAVGEGAGKAASALTSPLGLVAVALLALVVLGRK